jgi:hypothetical protein
VALPRSKRIVLVTSFFMVNGVDLVIVFGVVVTLLSLSYDGSQD